MYSMGVALPLVQADFSATRGDASCPMLTMIGFGIGGILMGRLADRFGIVVPVMIGALGLGAGFVLAGTAPSLVQFSFAHGVQIGLLGCSATFAPLVADTSLWFNRRRGIAVAICASGNYLAGTVWPPILQYAFSAWRRATHVGLGCFCTATMLLLALVLRPAAGAGIIGGQVLFAKRTSARLVAERADGIVMMPRGVRVAMSMPQVHIVGLLRRPGLWCGARRGMLSLMFGFGVLSRLAFGFVTDRLGGLPRSSSPRFCRQSRLRSSSPDSLVSLYIVSALFGVFQGGLVPQYAIVVREYFAPREAGVRVGIVLMSTLLGMALGGWISGRDLRRHARSPGGVREWPRLEHRGTS